MIIFLGKEGEESSYAREVLMEQLAMGWAGALRR